MDTYYRITEEYNGEHAVFAPTYMYEQIRKGVDGFVFMNDLPVEEKITEVCFSKWIQGCFFAINMFLKDDAPYYLYETNQVPDMDLSASDIGDFPSIKEVRYRTPVTATYVGKIKMHSFLLHCLTELYEQCSCDTIFLNEYALKQLENYESLKNEIA